MLGRHAAVSCTVVRHVVGRTRWKSTLAGRLGDPNMTLSTEPRMNQAMLNHLKPDLLMGRYGPVGEPFPLPFGPDSPLFLQHKWNDIVERHVLPMLMNEEKHPMPDGCEETLDQYTEVITGADGNQIILYIAKPKDCTSGPMPGILHTHGGGMCFMSANDTLYRVIRAHLASRGFVVVSAEFRNSSGKLGRHPYPAGLTDCMSALTWARANQEKLGISKLILAGESGGGNLCSAMAIRAKREGRLDDFDGVFAMCPFIAGPEIWKAKALTSLKECDGYFVDMGAFKMCAKLYDPAEKYVNDPCAWPLSAKTADLEGLPPHVISVNELDPLRDEGLAYVDKLIEAGVRAESRVIKGTPHGGDLACASIAGCEHIFDETVASMRSFAESL